MPSSHPAPLSPDLRAVYSRAQRHLARRDPVLKRVIAAVGPCTLRPTRDGFLTLTRSIVSQMISTKAALSIFARIEAALGGAGVTPAAVRALEEDVLRKAGLSAAKARAILELAEKAHDERLPLAQFGEMSDEEVLAQLLPLRGIGRWTAEMFLIFSLGRLDVLPVGDLGLRAGVQREYELEEMPKAGQLRERATAWQPYRSIATWYFWRSRGPVPSS
jgi:DNA-3-methyladenine glycosylase II